MAALRRMRQRNRGTIVNVGSALGYRSVPLQSIYCGAKFAIRGFTDALRSELIHDRLDVHLTMVDLPAVNTPQFDWALNKMGRKAKPVAPIYQPEVPARAIFFAATHRRRQVWVGLPTVKAILANRIAPGLIDRYLARAGYTGQLTDEPLGDHAPANLYRAGSRGLWRAWPFRCALEAAQLGDVHGSAQAACWVIAAVAARRVRAQNGQTAGHLTRPHVHEPLRSRTTRSSATAKPPRWWHATARSTGCAGRVSTATPALRRCSARATMAAGGSRPQAAAVTHHPALSARYADR